MKNNSDGMICCKLTGEVLFENSKAEADTWGDLEAFAKQRFQISNEKILHPVRMAFLIGGVEKAIPVLIAMVGADVPAPVIKSEFDSQRLPVVLYEALEKYLRSAGVKSSLVRVIMQALTTSPLYGKTYTVIAR